MVWDWVKKQWIFNAMTSIDNFLTEVTEFCSSQDTRWIGSNVRTPRGGSGRIPHSRRSSHGSTPLPPRSPSFSVSSPPILFFPISLLCTHISLLCISYFIPIHSHSPFPSPPTFPPSPLPGEELRNSYCVTTWYSTASTGLLYLPRSMRFYTPAPHKYSTYLPCTTSSCTPLQ
jgi:hypothetical protein